MILTVVVLLLLLVAGAMAPSKGLTYVSGMMFGALVAHTIWYGFIRRVWAQLYQLSLRWKEAADAEPSVISLDRFTLNACRHELGRLLQERIQ